MEKCPLPVVRTRDALQARIARLRGDGAHIGFVPTMGGLHAGHMSLVETARAHCDAVVASIFVNPAQFAPGEDFDAYPRDERRDLDKLAAAGCALAYLPSPEEIYPPGSSTDVRVEGLSDLLDGRHRPHFFYGVTTVVARLFLHVAPDIAVFGEKDYQQLQIIRRMVGDLGFPVKVIGAATVRSADGLAHSSRNAYLDAAQRQCAGALFAAVHRAGRRMSVGASVSACLGEADAFLRQAGWSGIDYVTAVDPETLKPLDHDRLAVGEKARLLGAGHVGDTRLIDNLGVVREA